MNDAAGYVFGTDPDGYDAARPAYPDAVFALLRERCGLGPGSRAFEIGAGTGTATRPALRADPALMVAIEPDRRMARHLPADPRLRVIEQPFAEAALAEGAFDLGFAATSFHWLDPLPTLHKVSRILRPGGWWAMWWTVFGDPDDPDDFHRAADPLFRALDTVIPDARPFALQTGARLSQMREAGLARTEFTRMGWSVSMDAARTRALTATFSQVISLDASHRAHFLDEIAALVRDRFGGCVERRFVTALYLGQR